MKHLAPYQLFFPLGILSALLAIGVWLVQDLNWFASPVILIHSRLISGGFIWSFILGFLMTAIPRMSGGAPASPSEDCVAGGLLLSAVASAWQISGDLFYISQMLTVLFVLYFALRRIVSAAKKVPVFFSHVGMGLLLAFGGAYAHFKGDFLLGFHLYHLGAALLLVLGIGTRFFSFLSGLPSDFETSENSQLRILFHASGALTCLFLVLAGLGYPLAYLGLTLTICFYLFFIWKIQRSSSRSSALRAGVRMVALTIPLGFLLCYLQPDQFITWLHLIFIGCFALMIFVVATRVTLAHGAYSLDLELKSKALWVFLAFLVVAALSRVGYGISNGMMRKDFLYLAALTWFAAILSWCFSFLSRIFLPGPQTKPSC